MDPIGSPRFLYGKFVKLDLLATGGAGEVGVFLQEMFRMGGSGPSEREHAAVVTQ